MVRKLGLAWVLGSSLLAACGGGGSEGSVSPVSAASPVDTVSGYPGTASSCDAAGQRAWLRDYMNDQYFWFDKQATPNETATSVEAYFDSLLFKPIDRYSYPQTTALFTQFFAEGTRTGYGYALAFADAAQTQLLVRVVEPLSPVGMAGLRRGDKIVSIDGFTPAQIASGQLAGVSTVGVPRSFVVTNQAGVQRSFSVNSANFRLSPVLEARVLTAANGAKVGYLMYQEFISSGDAALVLAFNNFKAAGVSELVLDLRYNGGGSTTQARKLSSLIGGTGLDGQVFAQYRFNAKNVGRNFSQTFTASETALGTTPLDGLRRVFVITSPGTASASEMVINGLRPFKPVITIGSTTFGKPYAFQPREACGITYSAVNLDIANKDGFSDYSAGFAPTCALGDDLNHQLGDPSELRTAAALSYITTGACPAVAANLQENKAPGQSKRAQAAIQSIAFERQNALGFGEVSPPQLVLLP